MGRMDLLQRQAHFVPHRHGRDRACTYDKTSLFIVPGEMPNIQIVSDGCAGLGWNPAYVTMNSIAYAITNFGCQQITS